jgi:hypothetical protein
LFLSLPTRREENEDPWVIEREERMVECVEGNLPSSCLMRPRNFTPYETLQIEISV